MSHLEFELLGKVDVNLQLLFQVEVTEETVLKFLYASFDWSMLLSLLSGYPWVFAIQSWHVFWSQGVASWWTNRQVSILCRSPMFDPKKSNNRKLFNILSNPHQHLIRMPWILIGSSYRSTKTSNKKHPKVLSLTPWFQCLEYPEFPSRLKSKTTSHLLPILRGQSLLLLQLLGCPMRTAGWMRTRPLVGSSLYCNLYQWSFLGSVNRWDQ